MVTDRVGSVRFNHAPALNGGTKIRSKPSRLCGYPALYSGRSIKSHQCRRPANSSPTGLLPIEAIRPRYLRQSRSSMTTDGGEARRQGASGLSERPLFWARTHAYASAFASPSIGRGS